MKTCKTCKFKATDPENLNNPFCHRFPPQRGLDGSLYPIIHDNLIACGEHQPMPLDLMEYVEEGQWRKVA